MKSLDNENVVVKLPIGLTAQIGQHVELIYIYFNVTKNRIYYQAAYAGRLQ